MTRRGTDGVDLYRKIPLKSSQSFQDPEMYSEVIKEHEQFEEIRKQMRLQEIEGRNSLLNSF